MKNKYNSNKTISSLLTYTPGLVPLYVDIGKVTYAYSFVCLSIPHPPSDRRDS